MKGTLDWPLAYLYDRQRAPLVDWKYEWSEVAQSVERPLIRVCRGFEPHPPTIFNSQILNEQH